MAIPEWLKITPTTGIGDRTLILTPEENRGTASRECTLEAETDYGARATCRVIQEGAAEFVRIASCPESIGPSQTQIAVAGESNAGTLRFTLPSSPAMIVQDVTADGQYYRAPGDTLEIPDDPGAAGAFAFSATLVVTSTNSGVEDRNISFSIGPDGGAPSTCTVIQKGKVVNAEFTGGNLEFATAGGSKTTGESVLQVRDGIDTLRVSRGIASLGSFEAALSLEISVRLSPDSEPASSSWTDWTALHSGRPTEIDLSGHTVSAYRIRVTAPENTEEIEERKCYPLLTFSAGSGDDSGSDSVRMTVTQAGAKPDAVAGDITAASISATAGTYETPAASLNLSDEAMDMLCFDTDCSVSWITKVEISLRYLRPSVGGGSTIAWTDWYSAYPGSCVDLTKVLAVDRYTGYKLRVTVTALSGTSRTTSFEIKFFANDRPDLGGTATVSITQKR